MPYLTVRDTPHYYEWIATEPFDAHKPVMVFVHGWGGSARYWESTAAALKPAFNCLLYDLRGFGRSPQPAQPGLDPITPDNAFAHYGLDTYAEDLAQLLEGLKLESVYLNAHSTGSSIALLFLNRYPQRVHQAILTCNGIFEYEAKAFGQFHQFGGYVVKFRPRWLAKIPGLERLFMARFLHQSIPLPYQKAFLEDFLMADESAALGTMYTAVSQQAAIAMPQEFSQLQVPTLLISGEFDQIIPAQMGQQAAALNSAYLAYQVIPNTAHFPMLEDAATYLAAVTDFIRLGRDSDR